MLRTCVECGSDFDARSSRAQRCSAACRKRSSRKSPKATPAPLTKAEARDLVEAVTARLDAAGALGSVDGQAALVLARRIAAEVQLDTGTNLVAMLREMRSMLDAIGGATESGGQPALSPLDEIAKRRERRAAV